jgi:16S rRNA (guanine527-N7)-methyltransferase
VTAPAFRDRLAARLESAHLTLTAEQIDLLDRYWQLLERWNSKINLTALPLHDYPTPTIDRLIVEPLAAAAFVPLEPLDWYDLGSGGGSPAVPLKVLRPSARLTMVESRSRKAAFLREVLRTIGLTATVAHARLEDVAREHPAAADYVSVRAVRADELLLDATRRLLRPQGRLILFESRANPQELDGFDHLHRLDVFGTGAAVRVVVPRGTKG